MKKIFRSLILLVIFTISLYSYNVNNNVISASSEYVGEVQLGGDTIGLQINTNVEIVGKYEVVSSAGKLKPWEKSNIQKGDFIYSVENVLIKTNDELNQLIKNTNKLNLNINIVRKDEIINTNIEVVKNKNNENSIGLYVKDHITGIGTLTFVNLKTNKYAALGHNVSNALSKGNIYESSIKGIKKAVKGIPGEKYATLSNEKIGTIENNINIGVFGSYTGNKKSDTINVIKAENVQLGPAEVITVLNGNIKKTYKVNIVSLEKQDIDSVKGIKIEICDNNLIEEAGGIIQGMSGSPIIQNGNLVGAVSHVVVNDPHVGFGVYAEWMYYHTT